MSDVPKIFDRDLLVSRRDRLSPESAPTFLLELVADDLLDRLAFVQRRFTRILVVGAYHGAVGRRLAAIDPRPEIIVELEGSSRLLAACQGLRVSAREDALPFAAASFDLVVSPLALQFVDDLPGALAQIRRVLCPDGLFLGVIAGGATLNELRQVMLEAEADILGGASPRVAPFCDVRDAGALLQRAGFALPVADAEVLTVTYASALELMRELKAMGAGNVLHDRSRKPVSRRLLLRAAEIYSERFQDGDGRIPATFELITMTGWAPDENQQRPLQPGSATVRLADALRTRELPAGERTSPSGKSSG